MKLSVDLDEHIESPPDKVGKALTDSTMLARWLMPNDFELRVGKRFTFFPDCPTLGGRVKPAISRHFKTGH